MILSKRCWYPAFVIYRWRHVLWVLPVLALLGLLALHWNRLRWDHVSVVCSTRAATSVLTGPEPARVSQLFEMVHSPEVLGKAARESGLSEAWQASDEQAAQRLRDQVTCETLQGGSLFEVKIRKLGGGDALTLCNVIQAKLDEQLREASRAKEAAQAAEREAVFEKAVTELQAELEANRAEFLATTPTVENPVDGATRFESLTKIQEHRRLLEELQKRKTPSSTSILCAFTGGPLDVYESSRWATRPATRHLQHFGISAAWTFGVSMLLAIAVAYLLEAIIPRKAAQPEPAPEGEPAHG